MPRTIDDLPVHPLVFDQAIATLGQWARESAARYVSTCTVYTLMKGLEDERVFAALKGADLLTADGMPLVWLQRLRGHRSAERVYGPDLMLALLKKTANDPGVKHFFYGGLPGVPEKLEAALMQRISGIQSAGAVAPPVGEVGDTVDAVVVDLLNNSGAQVIWVGLGSPKQDMWMNLYRPVLNAPLLIGVGAAFDFISGTKAQAPVWMRTRGLEWLYRLYQEPRRLGKRYIVYNTIFAAAVIRSYFRR